MLETLVPVIITIVTTIGTMVPILAKLNQQSVNNRKSENIRSGKVDELINRIDKLETTVEYTILDIMRLTAWDKDIPLATRVAACIRYVKHGGNHETQALAEQLKADNPELWLNMEGIVDRMERNIVFRGENNT